jgi:hypothetical protein
MVGWILLVGMVGPVNWVHGTGKPYLVIQAVEHRQL